MAWSARLKASSSVSSAVSKASQPEAASADAIDLAQALRHRAQAFVPRRMAEGVVDLLEVVHVKEQDPPAAAMLMTRNSTRVASLRSRSSTVLKFTATSIISIANTTRIVFAVS